MQEEQTSAGQGGSGALEAILELIPPSLPERPLLLTDIASARSSLAYAAPEAPTHAYWVIIVNALNRHIGPYRARKEPWALQIDALIPKAC
jgi:hypothetical protein